MSNPFSVGGDTAPNPRGPSFAIKTGDETFRGRAVNGPYCLYLITESAKHFAKELDEAFREKHIDPINEQLSSVEERLAALEETHV